MITGHDQHPADRLIHALIVQPRAATAGEIRLLIERIAPAPFNPDIQNVPARERGRVYEGITLGRKVDSVILHLSRRVLGDHQWAPGTTADEYVASLHRAARDPQARLALYRQWQLRDVAAIIVPTRNVLTAGQLGEDVEANLLVVYNATRGILTSGYQFSAMETIDIPGDALWLR